MPAWLSWGHPWSLTPPGKPLTLTVSGMGNCPKSPAEKVGAGGKEGGESASSLSPPMLRRGLASYQVLKPKAGPVQGGWGLGDTWQNT